MELASQWGRAGCGWGVALSGSMRTKGTVMTYREGKETG